MVMGLGLKKWGIVLSIWIGIINHHHLSYNVIHALNVGIQSSSSSSSNSVTSISTTVGGKPACSRKCESQFCSVPPFLRYGKYCGLLYSGCPGEKPCDGLDACCMKHDACVQAKKNDYLSQECSKKLLKCMAVFKRSSSRLGHMKTFRGNKCQTKQVVQVLSSVMKAALLAGRYLHKP